MDSMRNIDCGRCAAPTAGAAANDCPYTTGCAYATGSARTRRCGAAAASCPTAASCPDVAGQTAAFAATTARCAACGGCPCACPETRESALRRVQQYGFMTDDLRLFLNTHPTCEEALEALQRYIALERTEKAKFEDRYGSLTLEAVESAEDYDWISCPWPWHVEG